MREMGRGRGRPVNKIEQLPLKSFKCYCLCALPQVISTLVLLRHATPPSPSARTQYFLLTQSERREVLQLRLQLQVPVPVPVTVPIPIPIPSCCCRLLTAGSQDSLLLLAVNVVTIAVAVAVAVAKYVSVSKLQ